MILSDKDALARLHSPNNLINSLRSRVNHSHSKNAMNLFVPSSHSPQSSTFVPPNPFDKSPSVTAPPVSVPIPALVQQTQLSVTPEIVTDDILHNSASKIKLTLAHNKALDVLVRTIDTISTKIDDIKPDRLATIVAATTKTIETIRKEQLELSKDRQEKNVHFHFYEPKRNELSDYEIIDV